MRAISSWSVAGTLTLVLSTTAVALTSHTPASRAPLSEPIASHTSPTTVPPTAVSANQAPAEPTTSAAPSTTTPIPATVTYTYSGDDGSPGFGSASSGGYGDD